MRLENKIPMPNQSLLPEEDAIGDPDDEEGGLDDTLPADLWYAWIDLNRSPAI